MNISEYSLGFMSSFLKHRQVHFAATEAALRVHFGRCGNIKRVTLLAEPATGKPKGLVELNISIVVLDSLFSFYPVRSRLCSMVFLYCH